MPLLSNKVDTEALTDSFDSSVDSLREKVVVFTSIKSFWGLFEKGNELICQHLEKKNGDFQGKNRKFPETYSGDPT